jgi:hypothetical protein
VDKKPLIGMIVIILIVLPAVSTPSVAESDTELYIGIFGGIPVVGGLTIVNGWIMNIGDNPAYNISYTFSITGGFNNDINETFSGNESKMPPKSAMGGLYDAYGFGPVTITLSVSASNADNVTKIINGFQIGKRTLISFPMLRLFTFALMLRVFVYWGQNQSNFSYY